jgi:multiple sugar transport system substrate-binding protein
VVAVLSLAEVGRLPRDEKTGEVAARFKLAPLPGTRTYFDAAGQRKPAERQANYVPYLGSGGWVGVVFKRVPAQEAAWDLLAELASPTAAAARLSDPNLGAGPYRTEHLDESRDQVWLRYGFDAARMRELSAAMRRYVRPEVSNPALVLRTPDQAKLMALLEAEVRRAASGSLAPAEAMKEAQAAWQKLDAAHAHEELVRWRRNAIGLP